MRFLKILNIKNYHKIFFIELNNGLNFENKNFDILQELELKCNAVEFVEESKEIKEAASTSPGREIEKPEPPLIEEIKIEVNLPKVEEEAVPQKVFPSMLPLSERIRKKPEPTPMPKSHLEIEASIIESSIEMEAKLVNNGEDKSMLSTALRELLEAQIDEVPMEEATISEKMEISEKVDKFEVQQEFSSILEINQEKPEEEKEEQKEKVVEEEKIEMIVEKEEEKKKVEIVQVTEPVVVTTTVINQEIPIDNQENLTQVSTPIKVASPPREVGLKDPRLKDPRTCGPKDSAKMETPVKRKVRMVGLL